MPRLLAALSATLESSVRTGHPLFLNQLYARPEPAGIAGAPLPRTELVLAYVPNYSSPPKSS